MNSDNKEIQEEVKGSSTSTSPYLQVISGHGVGRRLRIVKPLILGRAQDCDLVINDRKVSRQHIEVKPVGKNVIIRDMGSKNGVFLNGRQTTGEEILKHGDVLLLGETFLTVQFPNRKSHERYGSRWLVTVSTVAETHFDEVSIPEKLGRENLTEEDLKILMEVLALTQEDKDYAMCLRRITQRIVKLFHADSAVLCLSNDNDYEPAIIMGKEKKIHFLSNILQKTMMQQKGILIKNIYEQLSGSGNKIRKNLPASQMCVPFIQRGKIVGVIAVGAKRPLAFTKTTLNFLTVLANHLAPTVSGACDSDGFERVHSVEMERLSQPMIGESEPMKKLQHIIDQVAPQPISVLITGETGTGKELVARSIHEKSPCSSGPFICVNCAAIPADIFESELFGYERGAFTGADRVKPGKFELANNGTIFFDEVGELPYHLQAKLLRVLETQEFMHLGGIKVIETNARFLFATNCDLAKSVKEQNFREDLYYRINTIEIHVPPLRERVEDIPILTDYFLDDIQKELRRPRPFRYSPPVIGCFLAYHWPGNIRELRNVLEQMSILASTDYIDEDLLPDRIRIRVSHDLRTPYPREEKGLLSSITDRTQKQLVFHALKEAQGQKKRAAEILGISRPTLDKKIRQYGIDYNNHDD